MAHSCTEVCSLALESTSPSRALGKLPLEDRICPCVPDLGHWGCGLPLDDDPPTDAVAPRDCVRMIFSMKLKEFLEARIDEDELLAEAANSERFAVWDRAAAELMAKRELVKLCSSWLDGPSRPHAERVMRIMAAAYNNHPDYRQEWGL